MTHRRRQQRQPDQRQQIGDVLFALSEVVLRPLHQRVEHLLLGGHVQVVALQQLAQLGGVQLEELLVLAHLQEFVVREGERPLQQRGAALLLGEQREAETVGGVQLLAEEVAAGADHGGQLQQAGGGQQRFDGVLAQFDGACAKVEAGLLAGQSGCLFGASNEPV